MPSRAADTPSLRGRPHRPRPNFLTIPLTLGQFDSVNGTNRSLPLDDDLVVAAIRAPGRIDPRRARLACRATAGAYAALRSHLLPDAGIGGMQVVEALPPPPSLPSTCWFRELTVEDDALGEAMDRHVRDFTTVADVRWGPTWSVCVLNIGIESHVLFAVTHFAADYFSLSQYVRTFIRNLSTAGTADTNWRCRYVDYALGLQSWRAPDDARELLERLRTTQPLPQTIADAPLTASRTYRRPSRGAPHLNEPTVMVALQAALREIAGPATVRIDATRLGRHTVAARSAGGWIAHAVPQFFDGTARMSGAGRYEARYPSLFYPIRHQLGPRNPQNYAAHALVNHFGRHDPLAWSFRGFRLSETQPRALPRLQRSDTPIHLKVRLTSTSWELTWKGASQVASSGLFDAVTDRVSEQLGARRTDGGPS